MNTELPSAWTMFRRAIVLKCPHCGSRRTFIRHWLLRYDRCRTCGIKWHREHGFELGPIALNTVFTCGTLGIAMIVAFVATAPDFPVLQLTLGMVAGAVLLPLLAFPFTNLVWMAFDLLMHRPDDKELVEAGIAVAEQQFLTKDA